MSTIRIARHIRTKISDWQPDDAVLEDGLVEKRLISFLSG